jgi:hypothetical protein
VTTVKSAMREAENPRSSLRNSFCNCDAGERNIKTRNELIASNVSRCRLMFEAFLTRESCAPSSNRLVSGRRRAT